VDLSTGTARLARGLKNLKVKWEETCDLWDDRMRESYEEKHIELLNQLSLSTLREMDRLNQVLQQAQAECR
jgi:hypothetical protein